MSLTTAAMSMVVYQWSLLESNDPLFWFVNSSLALNLFFVIVSFWLVYLAFKSRFKSRLAYAATAAASLVLLSAGLIGLFMPGFADGLFTTLGFFDYMKFLLFGVISCLCSLSIGHRPLRLSLPQLNVKPTDAKWLNSAQPLFYTHNKPRAWSR